MTTEELTWQTDLNHAFSPSSAGDLAQFDVWYLKSLCLGTGITLRDTSQNPIGSPSGVWTVIDCSDSVSHTASDLWTSTYTPSKLVWCTADNAGQAHSWILLKSPHATPVYMLIQCLDNSGNKSSIHIETSCTAPTGGSITARPTFTNAWYHHGPTSQVQHVNNASQPSHFHGWLSTTGDVMFLYSRDGAGFPTKAHFLRQMVDTESGEASPMVSYFEFNDSNGVFQLNQYFSGSGAVNSLGWGGRSFVTATAAVVYQAILPYYSSSAIQVATAVNAITGKAPDFPVYLYCSTAGQNWKRGRIPDISTLPNVIGANKVEPSSGPPFGSLCVGNPSSGQGYVAMPWPGMAAGPSW